MRCVKPGTKKVFRGKADILYFPTRQLDTFFENEENVWFLAEPEALVAQERIKKALRELGVEDKPRRILVEPENRWEKQRSLRQGCGHSRDVHFHDYEIKGLVTCFKTMKKLEFPEVCRRARLIWDFLIAHLENYAAGSEKGFLEGEYEWSFYIHYTKRFDALFLTRLRAKAWLPGKDGQLHKPSELLPQELPAGFVRNQVLCDALQMKAEVLVNLAKEAGIKVEDIMFIRRFREEFDTLKRSLKEKPVAEAKRVEPPVVHAKPTEPSGPPQTTEAPGCAVGPVTSESAPGSGEPIQPAFPISPNDIAQALEALLGPDSAPPCPPPTNLLTPETPAGSAPTGNSVPITASTRTHRGCAQDRKHFTFVYVSPGGDGSSGDQPQGMEAAEIHRREKVGREGVEAALAFERQAGRNPTEMDHFHEGYDIESRNSAGNIERYIEVKAISAAWGQLGVTLSQPQFTTGQQLKDRYWLYVVENAGTPSQIVHRLQNPALEVKSFAYDHGWKAFAEAETST